jgi:choice-of-anchor A domain-containing protein
VLTAPSGIAMTFMGPRVGGAPAPGAYVGGDVVTGGGLLRGPEFAQLDGAIDTSGTDGRVADCTQAMSDVAAASTTLKNIPPTQTLPAIVVEPEEEASIPVGPGTQVINIPSITLKTGRVDGQPAASTLTFACDPNTTSLVINVANSVSLGNECEIIVDGDPLVVLNLHSERARLKLGKFSSLGVPLLAPTAKVTPGDESFTDALFTGESVKLKGTEVSSSLTCDD